MDINTSSELAFNAIKQSFNNYKNFIKQNPIIASEIESALRWISYLITATKLNNSHIVSELLYSCSSLLSLLNDTILRKSYNIKINANSVVENLELVLTFIEYIQVFSEFTAYRVYGLVGKWVIVSVIQITKVIIRLILLLKYNQGLQRHQLIPALDRSRDLSLAADSPPNGLHSASSSASVTEDEDIESATFKLKRTGRVLRTIESAPPRTQRTWLSPQDNFNIKRILEKQKRTALPSDLTDLQIIGEILHILKPVLHLTSLAGFGPKSWTPYLLSLGLDVTSLRLLSNPPNKMWNLNERIELTQRSFSLLLYLMRSPFYDNHTKERILIVLRFMVNHIPIFGRLIRPIIEYLPEWQKTYFYVWSV
ncbi:peroxisomal membrane protein PEX16-like [Oppia nitens]|uniref:peroxisomal membrane protein PEX16-like n=1 Tax=Oppia nitens TaxID=1686743 RepID=UPI0023DC37FF|nr:peroxisomal membrane protein PEX16-like [Oppia nitens]